MLNRIVVVLLEDLVTESKGRQFIQFVVHNAGVVMGIDVGLFLPIVQFLDEGSDLIVSAVYGLLEGFDDVRFFVLCFGFLGEDD